MSIISWNCRGLASPATIRELSELCRIHQPDIMFLMETRAPRERAEKMQRRLKFKRCFVVNPIGLSGGLCLFWNDNVHVQIFNVSPNFIHTNISFGSSSYDFDCSFVYGNPIFQHRNGLWSRLLAFQSDKERPWCCLGDFNEVLSQFDKQGLRPHNERGADLFRNFLNISGLMELDLKGCAFTWTSNPRNGIITKEKLDRVLVNWPWRAEFNNAFVSALPIISSDHSPLVLVFSPKERSGMSFKFEAFWVEHNECKSVIDKEWSADANDSDPWETIKKKLQNCQKALQCWHKKTFRKADDAIREKKNTLQSLLNGNQSMHDLDEAKRIQKDIDGLWKQDELFWQQRSRIKWLNRGDRNSRFFHASTIQRRGRNRIHRIQNKNGGWVEGKDEVFGTIMEHFREVYTSDNPTDMIVVLNCIPQLVTEDMNLGLMAPVSELEIKNAVFSMGALRAPGPDGFNGLFYQKNWDSVKEDIILAVRDFFNGGLLLGVLNETTVTLIPKVPLPESINQLRPISCCNFTYKILSKVVVLRLKKYMDTLISPNQSAFVGGRQIQDNLIIAHEVFHSLKRRDSRGKNNIAIKLDMSKAYDRLEWSFIKECLLAYGFSMDWVSMVMKLISSVSYKYKVNGFLSSELIP